MQAIQFVFTIAVVLQVAIWAREIVIGMIQRRAADRHNETLINAMGIIRLLISVALFAIAAIVILDNMGVNVTGLVAGLGIGGIAIGRSEEHTSELQSLMRISYAVFCLKKKIKQSDKTLNETH